MRYMIVSDIHGSAYYCKKLLDIYKKEQAEKLIILGDILYHGPRNDLPLEYAPKTVISLLNEYRNEILAVRGNCDAEVDQMVLDFPIMADYAVLPLLDGRIIYLSHGHIYYEGNLPPMKEGDIFLQGHTHVLRAERKDGIVFLNPGSVSIPKEGNPPSYAILADGKKSLTENDTFPWKSEVKNGENIEQVVSPVNYIFTIKTFDDEIVKEYNL